MDYAHLALLIVLHALMDPHVTSVNPLLSLITPKHVSVTVQIVSFYLLIAQPVKPAALSSLTVSPAQLLLQPYAARVYQVGTSIPSSLLVNLVKTLVSHAQE